MIAESACCVSLGTVEEAHPTSASSPKPTSEFAITTPARLMFMGYRPFLNLKIASGNSFRKSIYYPLARLRRE